MPEWAAAYLEAWSDLRHDRSIAPSGMPGRIWYRSISAYAHDHGIAGESFGEFKRILLLLDDEFLDFSAERLEEAMNAAKSGDAR